MLTQFIKGSGKNFSSSKVIAGDIDETWFLHLAHVYKIRKQNAGVMYLLIAVDCLSIYLRVEPLKSRYTTTTSETLKK